MFSLLFSGPDLFPLTLLFLLPSVSSPFKALIIDAIEHALGVFAVLIFLGLFPCSRNLRFSRFSNMVHPNIRHSAPFPRTKSKGPNELLFPPIFGLLIAPLSAVPYPSGTWLMASAFSGMSPISCRGPIAGTPFGLASCLNFFFSS